MNPLILFAIAAVVIVYVGFKWNNMRTKMAFFFILFGVLFLLFFIFLMINGSGFNFAGLSDAASSLRTYFLWIKGALVSVFQFTGKAIGLNVGNATAAAA